jgi:hypothetical protein
MSDSLKVLSQRIRKTAPTENEALLLENLVPWQPVLDKRIGQHITGAMRDGGGIEWSLGRKRELGL